MNPDDRRDRSRRRVAVLIAAHNRREFTVRAIRALNGQQQHDLRLTVVLFDDASTDGTGAEVSAEFPDVVILKGNGSAYWNGGMHGAWQHALSLDVDGFLWLNDDVQLDPDAVFRLAGQWCAYERDAPVILIGATRDAENGPTYGGMTLRRSPLRLSFDRLPIGNAPHPADTFNGNIVLVSRAVVDLIGTNDAAFFHAMGDIDYGLRARAAGVPQMQLPGTLGICELNTPIDIGRMTLRQRLGHFRSHRGLPFASWWRMTRRHSGFWFPLHFLLPYRRLLLPGRRR